MRKGNIVLLSLPQANGKIKNRPALVLREMPVYHDFLVCGISTQLDKKVKDFDEIISPEDQDFKISGLLAKSLIRLGFLAVFHRGDILGTIGFISKERYRRLLKNLSEYLIE
ncbi:type II toxin-antitoxin system PemK/MazF family toxin [bacterium]|nr:type II toxin-antitoxin system PemK/MazF family toxin [bacterium]